MVVGGDSCPEGRGFESQHLILDGQFFTLICDVFKVTEGFNLTDKIFKKLGQWL